MVTGTRVDAASSGFERAGVIPWLRGAGEGEGQGGCRARVEGCGDAHLGGGGLESLEEEAGGAPSTSPSSWGVIPVMGGVLTGPPLRHSLFKKLNSSQNSV